MDIDTIKDRLKANKARHEELVQHRDKVILEIAKVEGRHATLLELLSELEASEAPAPQPEPVVAEA